MTGVQIPLLVPFMYGVILFFLMFLSGVCVRALIRMPRKGRSFKSVVTALLLLFLLCGTVWTLLDLPCLISGDLESAVGTVVEQDSAGQSDIRDSRGFTIQDTETGQWIRILTIHTPIQMGEVYEVRYLPHTHIGYIVKRLQ